LSIDTLVLFNDFFIYAVGGTAERSVGDALFNSYLSASSVAFHYLKKDGESLFCLFSFDFWAVGSF